MRKILSFQRNTKSIVSNMIRGVACGATVAVTFCLATTARGQTVAQQIAPTAMSFNDGPVSNAVAVDEEYPLTVNDAGYSVLSDKSQVEPAQFLGESFLPTGNYGYGSPCDAGCDVSAYGRVEALYFRRQGDKYFSQTRNTFLPDFDWEYGARITIGCLTDCTNGYEGVYVGPFDWNRRAAFTGNGSLQSNLRPSNGYTSNDIDTFFDADLQSSDWRIQMQSIEANRRWWVWDVFSTMIGLRYIDYEEDLVFFSSGSNGAGLQIESLDNQMAGIQVGADMIYPSSLRCNVGFRGKAGAYANLSERRSFLSNNGSVVINSGDSNTDWAAMAEFGLFANYAILPSVRLTAGYDFWWMTQIATVTEQRPTVITPATGTTVFADDDVYLHGASLGAEIIF